MTDRIFAKLGHGFKTEEFLYCAMLFSVFLGFYATDIMDTLEVVAE